jgi:hypothetical protein
MHHAMNHVGFMISPELYIVQDKVHGFATNYSKLAAAIHVPGVVGGGILM